MRRTAGTVRLPASFLLLIVVALHRHRDSEGMMVSVVQRGCALPVTEVEDKGTHPGRSHLSLSIRLPSLGRQRLFCPLDR